MKIDTSNWWYCDNIIDHEDIVGLLHLGFPRVFIVFRENAIFATYGEWLNGVADVQFLDPDDRYENGSNEMDNLLTEAWNFMALQEAADEDYCNSIDDEYEEDDY